MKQLDTQLAHLFHYVDNLSMICLIVLEDLEEKKYTIFQQKIIQDIENWCQKVLKKLSIFLENDKFIRNKTCICIEYTTIFGNDNGDILQIYYKILNLLPEVVTDVKQIDMKCHCMTRNDKIFITRLSRFLNEIQSEMCYDHFHEMILFCFNTLKCIAENDIV